MGARVTRPRSLALLWTMAAFAVALLATVAYACMPQATVGVDPDEGEPGDPIDGEGSGFTPGAPIEVYFDSSTGRLLWSGNADTDGNIDFSFAVPDADPGDYVIIADQQTWDGDPARTTLTVTGDEPENDPPPSEEESNEESSGPTEQTASGAEDDEPELQRTSQEPAGEEDEPAPDTDEGRSDQPAPTADEGDQEPTTSEGEDPAGPADGPAPATADEGGTDEPAPSTTEQSNSEPDPQPAPADESAEAGPQPAPEPEPVAENEEPATSDTGGERERELAMRDAPALAPQPGQPEAGRTDADGTPSERAAADDLWSGLESDASAAPGLADGPTGEPPTDSDGLLLALGVGALGVGMVFLVGGALALLARRRTALAGGQSSQT